MTHSAMLAIAMLLDALLGEPRWLWSRIPHPIVLMGRAVSWIDNRYNYGPDFGLKVMGIFTLAFLCTSALLIGGALSVLPYGWIIETAFMVILIAQRSLSNHVMDVAVALRISLDEGREAVSQIVGRDTKDMDQAAVARAAVESAAENLSDGVIAPAFWFLIGGLPGLLLYKLVNTADSMIGHQNERYREFGWAAARLDDMLNQIPARLTALLIALMHGQLDFRAMQSDAALHRSPNAGWPEAAMARALGIALSGPRSYDGELQHFPYVNADGRKDSGPEDIERAVTAIWKVWATALAAAIAIAFYKMA